MASLALGLAGQALFGPIGGFVGGVAGGFIDRLIFAEDKETVGPRLADLSVTSSAYGRPIPKAYGVMRLGGNVVWSPGLVEHRLEEEQGGKGGPSLTAVTFKYTASFRVNFAAGPAAAVLRIWADGKLLMDRTGSGAQTSFLADPDGLGTPALRLYLGTETQSPDPAEQADKGVANTPAYRGVVGAVFQDLPLADYGNRIPQITAEVAFNAGASYPVVDVATDDDVEVQRLLWAPDRTWFMSLVGAGTIWRWDALGKQPLFKALAEPEITSGRELVTGTFAMDAPGNVYFNHSVRALFDTDGGVQGYGADTGALIALSAGGTATPGDRQIEDIFAVALTRDASGGAATAERLFVTGGSGHVAVLALPPSATSTVGGVPEIVKLTDYDLADAVPPAAGSYATDRRAFARDGEGSVWLGATDAANGYLFQLDGGSGRVVARATLAGATGLQYLTYLEEENALVCKTASDTLARYDLDAGTLDATLTLSEPLNPNGRDDMQFRNGPLGGRLWLLLQSGRFVEVDLVAMAELRKLDQSLWGRSNSGNTKYSYDALNHAILVFENVPTRRLRYLFLDRMTGGSVTVKEIVDDLSAEIGLDLAEDVDSAALSDTLAGYVVDRRMTARRALEPLAAAFRFRARESDWRMSFVKRGGAGVFALGEADLGARAAAEEVPELLHETRARELSLPETVELTYADPSSDYQTNTQRAKRIREAVATRRRVTVNFPGALDKDAAARIAETLLLGDWVGRNSYACRVDWSWLRLDPGDVGTVTRGGASFPVEVTKADFADDGTLALDLLAEDAAVHLSLAVGGAAAGFAAQTIRISGPTALHLMDTPLLRDADDGLGIYLAAGGFGDGAWPGASVYKSADGDSFLQPFAGVPATRNAAHGLALTALAADGGHGGRTWDRGNAVTLRLFRGGLASATELDVLNGANALLLGDEVVQFAGATLNADGSYTLTTLLRGRRGTEWAMAGHAVGERVVVLSPLTLLREALPDGDLAALRHYRAVTLGGTLAGGTTKTLPFQGRSQMPYAPVHLTAARGVSPQHWTLAWVRRTRLGGAWKDGLDVPLGEEREAYEVDILDPLGSPPGAVVRTITETPSPGGSFVTPASRSARYSASDQVADFGAVQDSLSLRVYQISATVGRGVPADASFAA